VSVPLQYLQELASRLPDTRGGDPRTRVSSGFDLDQWITDRGLDITGSSEWKGGRRWIFPICPWNSNHDNRSAYIVQFSNGAVAAGCLHNGCRGKDWHALRDLLEPGWQGKPASGRVVVATGNGSSWEPPVPFQQFDLPQFPVKALPGWLRDFVQALAVATQTPIDLGAVIALAVVAASCAKKVVVRMKPGYVEPVNIFVVVALAPGNRKTSVFRTIIEPLENHEEREIQRLSPEIARVKASFKIKESKLKKLQDGAASAAKAADQERLTQEAASLAAELAEADALVPPRYIADDCTTERLATLLRDQSGRIAVMSAEGDVFDLLAGRYSPTSTANFGVYLKGHAGDALRIDRVGRPPEYVKSPALTVGLAVQPDVIRGLTGKPGFRGRGLLGRFLYSLPASLLGHRDTNPPPVPGSLSAAFSANVCALLEIALKKDGHGEACPYELTLEADARERMQEFEMWLEPQLSEFGELGGITDWAGKLVGAVGRIAGILHMATLVGTPGSWDYPISKEIVKDAIQIGTYLIPHAKAAFAEMGADVFVDQAKMMLRWIEQNGLACFTKRDLHQSLRGTFKRVEDLERPLALLASHGFVRKQEETSHDGPGRRPSPVYDVNPLYISENASQETTVPARNQHFEDCENSEKGTSLRHVTEVSTSTSARFAENPELE
jgi:replicative DNA helicase